MPTRLLLEGGDLQELLAQVREEHGSRAKIVSAERVRAGGLTGLLRAERYELTVELSDDDADAPVAAAVAAPAAAPVAVGAPVVRAAIAPSAAGGSDPGSGSFETHVSAGQATVARQATPNQPAYPEPAKVPNAGPVRPATMPAIAAGGPEHGASVDELLALLEQRESITPDPAPTGGGFDEVLAELRGVAASHAQNGAQHGAQIGATTGIADGTPNGTATGLPHGVADGAANGGVMSPTNGTPNGATVHNGAPNGAPPSVHNGPSGGAAPNGTAHHAPHAPHGVANGMAHGMAYGAAPGSAQPATQPTAHPGAHPVRADAYGDQSALESALEAALPNSLRQAASPSNTDTTAFSMDPIFTPAKATPEAPPARTGNGSAPGAATPSAQNPPPAPASAQNGSATSATRGATSRPTAAPRTRPLSPDPRRPNHFLSFGDLETAPADSPLPQKLGDLGLPQRVIDRLPLGEAYPSVVRALLDEPTAPQLPSGPGMIITIIGELAGALSVAEDVARILRLDPDRILIASESPQVGRHMADPGDAGRQAARLRGGDQPRIVCVDAPAPTAWVQQVVVALRPDAVWCAVDATRKPADVARQLRSLPRVDALAVHALEATADPASPLALGVPVALLDGQPAGPHGWAALLCRRLFEEEFAGGDR